MVNCMMTIDEFQELAGEIVDQLPEAFFRKLNNGVIVQPQTKRDENSAPGAPLLVMGEYTHSYLMGQGVTLYYGSFIATYGGLDAERQREELRRIIVHEFRHHLEWLSGTRELADEDERQLAAYKRRFFPGE